STGTLQWHLLSTEDQECDQRKQWDVQVHAAGAEWRTQSEQHGHVKSNRYRQCNTLLYISGCPGIEEDKVKKYRSELLMLTFLGIFYLLLIFFTCVSNSLSHNSGTGRERRFLGSSLHRRKTMLWVQWQ
uniref:CD83 molecule n=1 Tax=Cyanoderma ruficeps TaxID=181631 RepID=A0A8C3X8T6_9PASS